MALRTTGGIIMYVINHSSPITGERVQTYSMEDDPPGHILKKSNTR